MLEGEFQSYWSGTASYEAIVPLINMDFDGLRGAVIEMLSGDHVPIDITSFQNDTVSFANKDDVLTYLIHLGYLAYDRTFKTAFIPNEEIRQEMILATKRKKWNELISFQKESEQLLRDTLQMDGDAVAKEIEKIHREYVSVIQYNNENSLHEDAGHRKRLHIYKLRGQNSVRPRRPCIRDVPAPPVGRCRRYRSDMPVAKSRRRDADIQCRRQRGKNVRERDTLRREIPVGQPSREGNNTHGRDALRDKDTDAPHKRRCRFVRLRRYGLCRIRPGENSRSFRRQDDRQRDHGGRNARSRDGAFRGESARGRVLRRYCLARS